MKWLFLVLGIVMIGAGVIDLFKGESFLPSPGRYRTPDSGRTVSAEDDLQEVLGFVALKVAFGAGAIGVYRLYQKDEDTWY